MKQINSETTRLSMIEDSTHSHDDAKTRKQEHSTACPIFQSATTYLVSIQPAAEQRQSNDKIIKNVVRKKAGRKLQSSNKPVSYTHLTLPTKRIV